MILAVGVVVVGAQVFTGLMMEAGDTAEHARTMYDESVTTVVIAASLVAVRGERRPRRSCSARMLASPLAESGPRPGASPTATTRRASRATGPEELASLADSFNQMAATLERQEQMRRDFIANAAHELRTPLTNLQGYLEALRDGVITADRATYESLREEAERLVRLSRSLDALAEGDAGEPARADRARPRGGRPGGARARRARRSSGPGSRSQIEVPATLPARADPDQLAQVLANLLSNAVRYTPAGGSVTVRAERRPGDLLVSIANTGEGIPPEDLDRVFERFYRVEKSRDRGARRRRHRARDREAARRRQRRPGRRRVARRADALLVQPARLSRADAVTAGRSRSSRSGPRPARPTGSA